MSSNPLRVHGSCHCGAISYEATVDTERVTICKLHRLPEPHGHGVQSLRPREGRRLSPPPWRTEGLLQGGRQWEQARAVLLRLLRLAHVHTGGGNTSGDLRAAHGLHSRTSRTRPPSAHMVSVGPGLVDRSPWDERKRDRVERSSSDIHVLKSPSPISTCMPSDPSKAPRRGPRHWRHCIARARLAHCRAAAALRACRRAGVPVVLGAFPWKTARSSARRSRRLEEMVEATSSVVPAQSNGGGDPEPTVRCGHHRYLLAVGRWVGCTRQSRGSERALAARRGRGNAKC